MKASDIITVSRNHLGDTSADRWTDSRLLAALEESVFKVNDETNLNQIRKYILIQTGSTEFSIDDVYKIISATYNDKPITFVTESELNRTIPEWRSDTTDGDITHLIYNRNRGSFRIYPIYSETDSFTQDPDIFGVITDIHTNVILSDDINDDSFNGETGNILELVYKRQVEISSLDTEIDLNFSWKHPLANYVTSKALLDNEDQQNIIVSRQYMSLFNNRFKSLSGGEASYNTYSSPLVKYNGYE